ncbi:hypothetical protein FGG08_000968 [Glutinoglossum americanum]|uniref:Uncharacterized protein n=1 Tax=Glutinoglossum americanum TaxID=1670608 RepID=A0A9P8L0P5_9PEZI|nr:hypothetical protein FGG08_000968 [Glutinoglossum americanum]
MKKVVPLKDDNTPGDGAQAPFHTVDRSWRPGGTGFGSSAIPGESPLQLWLDQTRKDSPWCGVGQVSAINPRDFEIDGHSEISVQPSETPSRSSIACVKQSFRETQEVPAQRNSLLASHNSTASLLGRDQLGDGEDKLGKKLEEGSGSKARGLEEDYLVSFSEVK